MKWYFLFCGLTFTALHQSCSGQKKTANSALQNSSSTAMQADTTLCDYLVSFISKGSGIDYKLRERYDSFIKEFEKQHHVHIVYENYRWGREGEIDYCFKWKGMESKMVQQFLQESAQLIAGTTMVNVAENVKPRGTAVNK